MKSNGGARVRPKANFHAKDLLPGGLVQKGFRLTRGKQKGGVEKLWARIKKLQKIRLVAELTENGQSLGRLKAGKEVLILESEILDYRPPTPTERERRLLETAIVSSRPMSRPPRS